jgi:arylsulfatase A-like enzyme
VNLKSVINSPRWIIALLCVVVFSMLAHAAPTSRPNIVIIVSDDQGWNTVGYHNGFVKTPNIDRIAAKGVQLDRFYVSPMCSPTREGLMTGRYPMHFGMGRSVVRPWAKWGLPPEERTIAEALGEAGYANRGAFGKWHMGHLEPQWHPLAQGFTTFHGVYNGAADHFTRDRDGETDWHIDRTPSDEKGYTSDLIGAAASDFITQHAKEGPFFCYVPFSAPHDPHQAPEEYVKRYAALDDNPNDNEPSHKQLYAAMIACMDDRIGDILQSIEKAGIADNTLVWFFSDNGGIENIKENNKPLRAGKLTAYEGGIRTVSAVWWPGVIEGGRKIEAPIVNIDIFPTIMSIVGGKTEGGQPIDGIDCSAVLKGGADKLDRDVYAFTGQRGLQDEEIAVTQPDGWKLLVIGPDVRKEGGIKSAGHKIQLFNVIEDPNETRDRASEKPELVEALGKKLIAFRASEPAKSLPPLNKKPADFKPPKHWELTQK